MKLYLARHGRTNYNDMNLCNSDPAADVHLTSAGVEQAKQLANKLKLVPIEYMFVSELRRTQQTAEIVNKFQNVPTEIAPLLNDHRSGYEGKSADLLMEALDKSDNRWTAYFNDGESIEDMKERVEEFLDELKTRDYNVVLVITSGWVIKMATALIKDISNEEAWMIEPEQGDYIEFDI